ncbi:MAG: DUF1858 domain-containing protein [Clostridia bacterium]|nr:MAG: DUF1858 domain-containing protein [Clostridia bacterium]
MISKDMSILEVLQAYPRTQEVFARYGMACVSCMGATEETIEAAARMHGLDLDRLLADLNRQVLQMIGGSSRGRAR